MTAAIGAVGCGKTYMACAELLKHLMMGDRGKTALVVGRTHTHVRDQLLPIFEQLLVHQDKRGKQLGLLQGEYRIIRSAPMTLYLPYGSKIIFWSLEGGKSVKGLNVTHALVDEVTDMDESDFNDVFDRTGREGVPGRLWCMGNPTNKFHWFYKRFWQEYEEHGNLPQHRAYCVALNYKDNPHTKHKWADWEKLYSYSATERARKLDGLWINTEGMVFPSWDPAKHCFVREKHGVQIGQDWDHYGGLDFGYKDPTAGLRIAKSTDGIFYVYGEYYKTGSEDRSIRDHANWFLRPNFVGEQIQKVYSDTHLDTVATYKREGLTNIQPVAKNAGSIKAGIALIEQLLQDGRLKISVECVNLIKEIETYEWSPSKDEPRKGYGDHAIDALRYVINELNRSSALTIASPSDVKRAVPAAPSRHIFCYETNELGQLVPVYSS